MAKKKDNTLQSLLFLGVGVYIGTQLMKQRQTTVVFPQTTVAPSVRRPARVEYFVPIPGVSGFPGEEALYHAYVSRALNYRR